MGDIFVINADGTGQVRLTNDGRQTSDLKPVWSSNDKVMFASVLRNGNAVLAASCKEVRLDGTGLGTIFDYDPDVTGFHDWSPDMSKIGFIRIHDEFSTSLYVMLADGTGQTRLADSPPLYFSYRVWSPDGKKIAFQNLGDYPQIYIISASDGSYRSLSNSTTGDGYPIWSPDGQKIAFIRGFEDGSAAVCVMNADGTGQREVSRMMHPTLNVPLDFIRSK